MTILTRLEGWRDRGIVSSEQHAFLSGLARDEPFSLFLELNILLYLGVLAFIGGLGWTVATYSQQLGDLLIVAALSALFAASVWYCFTHAPASTRGLPFDYVLYLGTLVWSVELVYIEKRFQLLSGQWDWYLLATAGLFFFLAYRFDNRLVLSLALSSLAGWFGLTISHWPANRDPAYRQYAIVYSIVVAAAGIGLRKAGLKPHFLNSYLHVAANVLFWALLSGVFTEHYVLWFLALLPVCGVSLAWGIAQRQFAFVAYAAVYGYIGVSSVLLHGISGEIPVTGYFVITAIGMVVILVTVARRFGRSS